MSHQDLPSWACSLIAAFSLVALVVQSKAMPTLEMRSASNNKTVNRSQLTLSLEGRANIPGLYDDQSGIITPLQGQEQFNLLVLGLHGESGSNSSQCSHETLEKAAQSDTISLVQFYMATCPDCQGFSPYFKRFASDIEPHWRRFVRIYTVNCNDFLNIHLCQEQNPKLIVPMVRWYKLPIIQRDARLKHCNLGYRADMLSIAHRQFIDEQRRDLIVLRRATLRFISLMLDELSRPNELQPNLTESSTRTRRKLFDLLPVHWHQLELLGREQQTQLDSSAQLDATVSKRMTACQANMDTDSRPSVQNFVLFENARSFIGRTLIADWSHYTCSNRQTPAVLIHRSSDLYLAKKLLNATDLHEPLMFSLKLDTETDSKANRIRRHVQDQTNRMERIQQRASLERFYSHLGASMERQPIRYAAAMTAAYGARRHSPRKREVTSATAATNQTFENANWTPESAYPGEERMRFKFNRLIATTLNLTQTSKWPGQLLNGSHPGQLHRPLIATNMTRVDPVQDDLTLMFLTDYYKGLDEIVHIDMLAKREVDGLQLMAGCYFLRDLAHLFPFQGNAFGSTRIGAKSIARYYIELVRKSWAKELASQARHQLNDTTNDQNLKENDNNVAINSPHLAEVHVSSRRLEQLQADIRRQHEVGLPAEKHFKWNYCAGSSSYLRGHTCSLWVIFHTLTVHEYLESVADETVDEAAIDAWTSSDGEQEVEYEFQIDYSKPPRRACNPANPDKAYLSARTQDLYVNSTNYVLANIINFVRFYLPCTNCAAHFSCMVEHSSGLNFLETSSSQRASSSDSHLLWLWEGHNRVNERTRGTHSEDPLRPKHIFPQFEACPKCYLERPAVNATFVSMRFHRRELVKFVVARYRKSALLNNKINIEDLFKKI